MALSDEQFIQLLSQHDRSVRTFIFALLGRIELVDDIMQETATVLWRRRHDFEPQRSFAAWARGIARLVTWDMLRRQQRQPQSWDHQALDALEAAFNDLDQQGPSADARLEALEACRQLLSPPQRQVLHHRYGLNESDATIAEVLGQSVAAVHKSLVRIRLRLRLCVQQRLQGQTAENQS